MVVPTRVRGWFALGAALGSAVWLSAAPATADPPSDSPVSGEGPTPEDRALLAELELLLEWELLHAWDPALDLPIPLDPASPPAGDTSPRRDPASERPE